LPVQGSCVFLFPSAKTTMQRMKCHNIRIRTVVALFFILQQSIRNKNNNDTAIARYTLAVNSHLNRTAVRQLIAIHNLDCPWKPS